MELVMKAVIFFQVFIQGGFFAQSYRIAAVILAVSLLTVAVKNKGEHFKRVFYLAKEEIFLFLGMILLFVLSVYFHHTPFQDNGRVGYLSLILLFYIAMFFVKDFMGIYKIILFTGVAESVVALIVYGGVGMPGMLVNARFMGTFQYANATALFMGIVLILHWGMPCSKGIYAHTRIIMLTTLMMTFSAGGISCYCITVTILQGIVCHKERNFLPLVKNLGEIILSAALAVGVYLARFRVGNMILVWLILASIVLASIFWQRVIDWIVEQNIKAVCMILSSLFIMEMVTGVWLFGSRIRGTGLERIHQMVDGIKSLCQNPLFGLGIHGWERYIEDQPQITYKASLIHNSYLQVGIEAGVIVMILMLYLMVRWFARAHHRKNSVFLWQRGIMAMTAVHFMADITFFFGGIIVVVISCVFYENAVDGKI